MGLKRVILLDALMLAGFYTLRIFAGSLATSTPVSKWLLLFSLFFFLGLAFQKRLAELRAWHDAAEPLRRRGYVKADLEHLNSMGTSASYMAVLVLALYIQSPDVVAHYARPDVLFWTLPCLLYWVSRLWLLAGRDEVTEDAIGFAFKDRVSYAVAAVLVIIVLLAQPI
ncbi:MAG: Decaprenyl-phosphate phosphoribosyltransferase [Verrucomicrobiaceae bacterium]|nr:Decaprenyl-phosphate phosphoribosyltransferase [Verrucomicrobiaceae bacterium]